MAGARVYVGALFLIFSLAFVSSFEQARGSNWETLCENTICQTTIYSYEKYWLGEHNQWDPIDESFYDCSEENLTRFCTHHYYFNVTGDNRGFVSFNGDERSFSLRMRALEERAPLFVPSINGSVLTYSEIFPSIDLRYQYLPDKLKEEIVIKEPLALLPEGTLDLAFDRSGSAQLVIEPSFICDALGTCTFLETEITDERITLYVPTSFLTSPERVYPLTIDPTLSLNSSFITWNGYIQYASTLSTYSRFNNPTILTVFETGPTSYRSALEWNLSSISNSATILNASLALFTSAPNPGYNISLWHMEGDHTLYPNTTGLCPDGNCLFYNDMGNETLYNKTTVSSKSIMTNYTLSPDALDDIRTGLLTDLFGIGITAEHVGTVALSARDNAVAANRPVLIITHTYEAHNLTYDANGNLIEGFGKLFTYDDFNKLRQINHSTTRALIAEFWYDHEGQRIKKSEYNLNSQGLNRTTYYPDESFVQTVYTNGTIVNETYIYANDKLLARIDSNNRIFYYHPDHLGSTSLVTNESGSVVEDTRYLPFGGLIQGDTSERYLYTGQELDNVTDFYYYGARYYDEEFRHFFQPDPIIQDIYNPQDLNRYSYVRNNPYKYTDPSGNVPVLAIPAIVYTVIEAGIDIGSLGYSAYNLVKDPGAVNLAATTADAVDLFYGPFSNPGPSGPIVRGGLQAAKDFEKKLAGEVVEESVFEGLQGFEDRIKGNDNSRETSNGGDSNSLSNSNIDFGSFVSNEISSKSSQPQSLKNSLDNRNNNKPIFSASSGNSKQTSMNNQKNKNSWWKNIWSKTQNKFSKNKNKQ